LSFESVTISTPDGDFAAYVAHPETEPAAAIVVIQEIFGVNAFVREVCGRLAAQGYLAIAPDLFWRIEPGIDLTDHTDARISQRPSTGCAPRLAARQAARSARSASVSVASWPI
jgi:dienelactone hydrolase